MSKAFQRSQQSRAGNKPEVCPQVHNLPTPQTDEDERRADAEPLDAGVCALVGVAQLVLAGAQVVHLGVDLADELVDAPELRLDGLELLRRLDGVPVLCVGADVDVEFNVAARCAAAASYWFGSLSSAFVALVLLL